MKIFDRKFWHNYWTKKRIEHWGAFFIGSFAVLLVFCSDLDNAMNQQIIIENVKQSNAYSFFQAKRIRQMIREAILEDSQTLLFLEPKLTDEEREVLLQKRKFLVNKIKEFDDKNNPEGGFRLLQKAQNIEREITFISYHQEYIGVATNLYQVAVVIASIALIISSPMLLMLSLLVGLTAIGFHMYGVL